jgi:hypothetical protein
MPKSPRKKRVSSAASSKGSLKVAAAMLSVNQRRAGMPSLDSILTVKPLAAGAGAVAAAAAVGKASKYRILVTNQVDAYEEVPSMAAGLNVFLSAKAAEPVGDNYQGTARKAAKLSIADAEIEEFDDLEELVKSLTPDKNMKKHVPKIKTDAKSNRVAEEKRNIRVRAFLYAASREDDNDFHLIIGRAPEESQELYMTMELSGLPPSQSASFKKLRRARNAYKKFFKNNLPGFGYEFPDPPIPVEIEGSLFFDMTHASGSKPGPKDLRAHMPTIWEVHPITKIVFEP